MRLLKLNHSLTSCSDSLISALSPLAICKSAQRKNNLLGSLLWFPSSLILSLRLPPPPPPTPRPSFFLSISLSFFPVFCFSIHLSSFSPSLLAAYSYCVSLGKLPICSSLKMGYNIITS